MEREDRLFDDYERTDLNWRMDGEPTFRFRNRSAQDRVERVRALLEEIFALYPPTARRQLRGRFRSDKDEHHEGALLELLFFAVLGPRTVSVNPDTPDFEFICGARTYLLEANAFDQGMTSGKLEQHVVGTIERKLQSSNYCLGIMLRGKLTGTPPDASFIQPIRELLETSPGDLNTTKALKAEVNLDAYAEGFCRLDVYLSLKSTDAPNHPLIAVRSSTWGWVGAEEVEWSAKLLRGLEVKAKKLNQCRGPAYLAVSVPTDLLPTPNTTAIRALYGTSDETRESGLPCFWEKRGRRRNSHVEGVVVCGKLLPQALDHEEMFCRLYMAPGAGDPPEPLSRLPRVWLEGGELRGQPGEKLGALVRDGLGMAV